jgi:hypothetical protein
LNTPTTLSPLVDELLALGEWIEQTAGVIETLAFGDGPPDAKRTGLGVEVLNMRDRAELVRRAAREAQEGGAL